MNVIFNFIHPGRAEGFRARPRAGWRRGHGRKVTPPGSLKSRDDADCRCVCGSLVARLVDDGVELKCRRCKRTLVVPLTRSAPGATARERASARPAG